MYLITDFGAKTDRPINTEFIQKAIDTAAADSSSSTDRTVVIPAGTFYTGALFLKPHVNLCLQDGAILKGSNNIEDYPKKRTRIEGKTRIWRVALINADKMDGLRIYGNGQIDGNGEVFWKAFWKRRAENPDCTNLEVERPRMFFLEDCKNIKIAGLKLRNSGFWNVHLYNCKDVLIEGLDIRSPFTPIPAPSTDGIDVDCCQNVIITDCYISVNDDCIALKCGKGPGSDKLENNQPVENIIVENCEFGAGHGVLTFGSEATIVRNVVFRNCTINDHNYLVRLKLRPDTPQIYENILYENINLHHAGMLFNVSPWTQFFDLENSTKCPISIVRNVTLRNIVGNLKEMGILCGNEGDLLQGFKLCNLDLELERPTFNSINVKDIEFNQVKLNGKSYLSALEMETQDKTK